MLQVVEDLQVTDVIMLKKFDFDKGAHLHMSWLRDKYHEFVETHMYKAPTRAYMLHLMVCSLFADKSHVYINARYVWLFRSLESSSWAWGVAALTKLYLTLGVATVFDTRQLVGYLNLL